MYAQGSLGGSPGAPVTVSGVYLQLSDDNSTSMTKLEERREKVGNGQRIALAFVRPGGDAKREKDKCDGVIDGVVDGVVGRGTLRGSHRESGLAERRRGLCRAQPVTAPSPFKGLGNKMLKRAGVLREV